MQKKIGKRILVQTTRQRSKDGGGNSPAVKPCKDCRMYTWRQHAAATCTLGLGLTLSFVKANLYPPENLNQNIIFSTLLGFI